MVEAAAHAKRPHNFMHVATLPSKQMTKVARRSQGMGLCSSHREIIQDKPATTSPMSVLPVLLCTQCVAPGGWRMPWEQKPGDEPHPHRVWRTGTISGNVAV